MKSTTGTIDWNTPEFMQAPFGTVKYWQYRAACYISTSGLDDVFVVDAMRLKVGEMAAAKTASGKKTCIWHEASMFFQGNANKCQCSDCVAFREEYGLPCVG